MPCLAHRNFCGLAAEELSVPSSNKTFREQNLLSALVVLVLFIEVHRDNNQR